MSLCGEQEAQREVEEVTADDSLVKSTRAEAGAGVATVDGAAVSGAPGTARGGRGRPSEKSINQSLLVSLFLLVFHFLSVFFFFFFLKY